ncbi:MAG: multicopper oxidase domain-containing protein [Chloroflexi bacterium]|nr:multicopper oxidase domain-containing protein [Chloroflexota bacterium]
MAHKISRRKFLALAGASGIGVGLAACSTRETPAPLTPTAPVTMSADEVDAASEKAIKKFIASIEQGSPTFFPRRLPFKLEGATKIFELTCQEILVEIKPDEKIPVLSFNGALPAPEIRVTEGDKVRVIVRNSLKESTAIHWRGIRAANIMTGAPFIAQPPIKPGQTFVYEFVARPAGSHLYHSQHNAAEQIARGLAGALVIEPQDKKSEPAFDSEYVMLIADSPVGLTINGKVFPLTAPITAKPGERVRVRWMNAGGQSRALNFHGGAMQILAQDGFALANPQMLDTLSIAPGQCVDALIIAPEPGMWAMDCAPDKIERGAIAMVSALIVK